MDHDPKMSGRVVPFFTVNSLPNGSLTTPYDTGDMVNAWVDGFGRLAVFNVNWDGSDFSEQAFVKIDDRLDDYLSPDHISGAAAGPVTPSFLVLLDMDNSNWNRGRAFSIDQDGVLNDPITAAPLLGLATSTFIYGFDDNTGVWDRIRVNASTGDGILPGNGLISTVAFPSSFNGTNWDRNRSASAANVGNTDSLGAQITADPGEWSENHNAAANTQATVTRAAVAGERHVCKSITATLAADPGAAAGSAVVSVLLRDGAAGAGTVLWSGRLAAPIGESRDITIAGLNIVGSAGTEMTLEFAAAAGADTFEDVSMTGYTTA